MKTNLLVLLSLIFGTCSQQQEPSFNLSFEQFDSTLKPVGWKTTIGDLTVDSAYVDSTTSVDGKFSMKLTKRSMASAMTTIGTWLPPAKKGTTLTFSAYLKSRSIEAGIGSLWIRVLDSSGNMVAYKIMADSGVTGTTNWRRYEISIDIADYPIQSINIGAYLTGTGTLWIDNLKLKADGNPIQWSSTARPFNPDDTNRAGNIELSIAASRALDKPGVEKHFPKIELAAKLWGFLKYYHPAIEAGALNWDSAFFSTIVTICDSPTFSNQRIFHQLYDKLGTIAPCAKCAQNNNRYAVLIKELFGNSLPDSLINRLIYLQQNHESNNSGYYVSINQNVGNCDFPHEDPLETYDYPPSAVRLLALCRYWNVIEYYFPYKYLIGQKWTNILTEFTPKFVHTQNKREYYLELLELVSAIHDSHAQLISKEIDYLKGLYTLPFQVKFIQGKLVVTNYYLDDKALKDSILPGDIIQNIDDTPVTDLLTRYLPFTSGSNIDAQLRDLTSARGFLPRSNSILANLTIVRNGKTLQVNINRSPIGKINSSIDYSDNYDMPSDTVLAGNIGYINPSKLKEEAFDQLRAKMQKTKGLIIDLRCYPSIFMPFIYGSWLKQSPSAFAVTTISDPQAPGSFIATNAICNGGNSSSYPPIQEHYQGKLVVLVSTHTQGGAEYSTMSLSSTPNALVVGSTTAGADGNISRIGLPGFLTTTFSGIGIYYPEFQETQRVGIKIDVPITPTIEAVKAHRDEYLERALKIINQ